MSVWYYNEVFERRVWEREETERRLRERSLARLEDPKLRDELWRKWAFRRFYNSVVFPVFDLGQLVLCPDYDAEKEWKNTYGKQGLLKHFTPGSRSSSWEGFWDSVEDSSSDYLGRVERAFEQFIRERGDLDTSVLQDALEYRWLEEFLNNFRANLTEGMWEAGLLHQEDPSRLSTNFSQAEDQMLLRDRMLLRMP